MQAVWSVIAQNSIVFRDIYLQCEICDKSGIKNMGYDWSTDLALGILESLRRVPQLSIKR